jgi:hypothetical protein
MKNLSNIENAGFQISLKPESITYLIKAVDYLDCDERSLF